MSATEGYNSADDVFATLENYNWDDDVEFQSGLSAILGTNSTPEQAAELTLRARCFYYARKYNVNIDFDAYKAYRDSHSAKPITPQPNGSSSSTSFFGNTELDGGIPEPPPSSSTEPKAPYPTSFAHIIELITTGQPIPGIKDIPDTVLSGQGTQPEKPKRRKPWEKDDSPTESGAEQGTAV